jgi:CheY-like chemotaxis protein
MAVSAPLNPRSRAVVAPGDSVLAVDDDEGIRRLLGILLRRHRGPVTIVSSVAEAIDVLEVAPVDVIVSDHSMPQATGLNLLAYVRARGLPSRFVLTSADPPPEVARAARAAGAEVVTKSDLVERLSGAAPA